MKIFSFLKNFFLKRFAHFKGINPYVLAVIIFIISLVTFLMHTYNNLNPTTIYYDEDLNPSFPVIYQLKNDYKVNEMRGFTSENYNIVSNDTISVLDKGRILKLLIKNNNNDLNLLNYEVRDRTSNLLLERSRLEIPDESYDKRNDETQISLNIQNLIRPNSSYLLTIKLNVDGRDIYYFTNIISRTRTNIIDALYMATDYTEKTFSVASASELVKYFETSANRDMREMYSVTLQQSFEQMTFADTGMKRISEYYYDIFQAQEYSYNIAVHYLTESTKTKNRDLYINRDEYVLRWDEYRWYYMKFNRHTEEILNLQNSPYDDTKNRFYLGITDPSNLEKMESDNKRYFAFCKKNEVYIYDDEEKTMTSVFSYKIDDSASFESIPKNYATKIMSVSDTGEVVYIVYGYNSSGRNEGNMGIGIFTYSSETNLSVENIFLPVYTTFQSLKYDISRLCVFKNNQFIFKSYNKVYSINIDTSEMLTLADSFEETKFAASTNSKYFAFNNDKGGVSKQINIYNIDDGRISTIEAKGDEYIEVVTFMNDDLFYGVFSDDDIWREAGKIIGRPSREIKVSNAVNGNEDVFKENEYYFYNFVNQQNLLRFNKYTRTGSHYTYKTNDVILNNYFANDEIKFPYKEEFTKDKLRIGYFEIITNRRKKLEYKKSNGISRRQIEEPALFSANEEELLYYVYDSGNLVSKIKVLSDAVNEIRDNYGYVKLNDRITCYNRANKGNVSYLKQDNSILNNLEGFEENIYIKDDTMLILNVTGVTDRDLEYYMSLQQKVAVYKNDSFQFFITGYDNNNYVLEYMNGDRNLVPKRQIRDALVDGGYVLFTQLESLE